MIETNEFRLWLESANTADEIAKQFFLDMERNHPGCRLGVAAKDGQPGSGNCAWTAREFFNWATQKGLPVQYLSFTPWDGNSAGHIVPVYDSTVIDFIKHYHYGKNVQYMLHRVTNPTMNKVLPLRTGGLDYYANDHQTYILANSLADIERVWGIYWHKKRITPDPDPIRITTFEPPRSESCF